METWHDFFVAVAGAAAALTGLIFVGVSLSLNRILAIPRLPGRASEALILLTTVLVVSALCLVPEHSPKLMGIEFLCIGIIVWYITFKQDLAILRETEKEYKKHYRLNILLTQLSTLPYIIAGIITLCNGYNGVYFLVSGLMMSFIKSVLDGWVLLVEIHR